MIIACFSTGCYTSRFIAETIGMIEQTIAEDKVEKTEISLSDKHPP